MIKVLQVIFRNLGNNFMNYTEDYHHVYDRASIPVLYIEPTFYARSYQHREITLFSSERKTING